MLSTIQKQFGAFKNRKEGNKSFIAEKNLCNAIVQKTETSTYWKIKVHVHLKAQWQSRLFKFGICPSIKALCWNFNLLKNFPLKQSRQLKAQLTVTKFLIDRIPIIGHSTTHDYRKCSGFNIILVSIRWLESIKNSAMISARWNSSPLLYIG